MIPNAYNTSENNSEQRTYLNYHNIGDIMDHPEKYSNNTVVIDGTDLMDRRKKFVILVEELALSHRHLPYKLAVINRDKAGIAVQTRLQMVGV